MDAVRVLQKAQRGFTLVEVLIAMALATLVGLAGYVVFSSTNFSYKVEQDVVEAQQNLRVAMDRLARDLRHAGFGLPTPPEVLPTLTFGSYSFSSPITYTNSSTAPDSITILGIGYEAATLVGSASGQNAGGSTTLCVSSDSAFAPNGSLDSRRKYINIGGSVYRELTSASGASCGGSGKSLGLALALDRAYPDTTPVYIIYAVTYSISTTVTGCSTSNPCLVMKDHSGLLGSTDEQIVAENIEDMQFAYGVDVSPYDGIIDSGGSYGSDDFVDTPSDSTSIIAVRASIVARTRNEDPRGKKEFHPFCLEDRAGDSSCTGASADGYRRRRLTRIVKLRNPRVQ